MDLHRIAGNRKARLEFATAIKGYRSKGKAYRAQGIQETI